MNRFYMKRADFDLALRTRFAKAYAAAQKGRVRRAIWRISLLRRHMVAADLVRLDEKFRRDARAVSSLVAEVVYRSVDLSKRPSLAWILIHSPNGKHREAAVRSILAPETDLLAMVALILRSNDWVAPVRSAAFERLSNAIPLVDASIAAELVPVLLDRVPLWKRGGAKVLKLFEERDDWQEILAVSFLKETDGPLVARLRKLLEMPLMDQDLERLAISARSSFVRAVCAETVLTACARWKNGYDWQWVDKPLGKRRRVAVWEHRKLAVGDGMRLRVFEGAAHDKSVQVRKVAAEVLIRDGLNQKSLVDVLSVDVAPAVRERVDYAKRKWHVPSGLALANNCDL